MKKFSLILSYFVVISALFFTGCSSTTAPIVDPVKTLADKIKSSWKVKTANESGVITYDANRTSGTNTSPAWANFNIDFTALTTGKLVAIDNANYTFSYTVAGETISLKTITPAISGGDYNYTAVVNTAETELTLTRTTPDPKAGNKTVVLVLVKK